MTLYRKRPVVVETWEFTKEALRQEDNWVDKYPDKMKIPVWGNEDVIIIGTLEGSMTATLGDFIIKGVEGELYPCKPDIFHKTYEKVNCRDALKDANGTPEEVYH